ncbi:MAG: hypothetical protein KJZ83_00015 [Burkholderiaceae bacterium]|nr:hypothetical protein [Burkholderiaceae bacterium]
MTQTVSDDDTPLGLAAAVRALNDPTVTVSKLKAAIKDGRLAATDDAIVNGRKLVTLGAIKAMLAPAVEPAEASEQTTGPVEEPVGELLSNSSKSKKCHKRFKL